MTGTATVHTGSAPSAFVLMWANMEYGGCRPEDRQRFLLAPDDPGHRSASAGRRVPSGDRSPARPRLGARAPDRERAGHATRARPVRRDTDRDGESRWDLVRTRPGLRIVDQWPPPGVAGSKVPWCKVAIEFDGLGELVHVYCLHLSARSRTAQLEPIETITNMVTAGDELAIVCGDFNGYPPEPMPTHEELAALPRHLQLTRCDETPDGLVPNLRVWNELTRAGLLDVAATLPASARDPQELTATGRGGARVDRCHAAARLAETAVSYRQVKTGSDHHAGVLRFTLRALTSA
jgi:hypothetical protein